MGNIKESAQNSFARCLLALEPNTIFRLVLTILWQYLTTFLFEKVTSLTLHEILWFQPSIINLFGLPSVVSISGEVWIASSRSEILCVEWMLCRRNPIQFLSLAYPVAREKEENFHIFGVIGIRHLFTFRTKHTIKIWFYITTNHMLFWRYIHRQSYGIFLILIDWWGFMSYFIIEFSS